jgi:predicted ATP-binding protein involved in virulence
MDVKFNDEITLLIGINGSGKTTVLNVIDWLLKPNLPKLATADYKKISIEFEHLEKLYQISSEKKENSVIISMSENDFLHDPIKFDLIGNLDKESDEALEFYSMLTPEKHELKLWEAMHAFPSPTIISLDRNIAAEADEIQYLEQNRTARRRTKARSPIEYVQEVTSKKYAEHRKNAIDNDNELKAKLVMSALHSPVMNLKKSGSIKPMSQSEINRLEDKVTTYLTSAIKSEDVAKQVKSFFSTTKLLSERPIGKVHKSMLVEFIITQYSQIERFAAAFNEFENNNSSSFKSLSDYISATNTFLKDSGKKIYFDESTGKLIFSFIQADGTVGEKRSIANLSSGERQILILFTFLAFSPQSQGVFIVDEPELSLHPKWQHEFMGAFLALKPESTQLLLATHSPDIVGKFRKDCVSLSGAKSR